MTDQPSIHPSIPLYSKHWRGILMVFLGPDFIVYSINSINFHAPRHHPMNFLLDLFCQSVHCDCKQEGAQNWLPFWTHLSLWLNTSPHFWFLLHILHHLHVLLCHPRTMVSNPNLTSNILIQCQSEMTTGTAANHRLRRTLRTQEHTITCVHWFRFTD